MNKSGRIGRAARRAASAVGAISAGLGLAVPTVGLVMPATTASAAGCTGNFTWAGLGAAAGNQNWSDGLNWEGGVAPTAGCAIALTFPFTAAHTGPANNDIANLEITALNITGPFTLTGNAVFIGDSGLPQVSVSASAVATLSLPENLRSNTVFGISSGNTLTVSSVIVDPALTPGAAPVVTANGPGTLVLSAANTYTGDTQISGGTLVVADPSGLGTATNTVHVMSGTTLQLGPSGTSPFIIPQAVSLAGTVTSSGPDERLTGLITLTGSGGGLAGGVAGVLTVNRVTGNGPLTINPSGATGTVVLGGTSDNNYTGGTTVAGGKLALGVTPNSGTGLATPNVLTVDPGASVSLQAPGQLDSSQAGGLTLVGSGSIDLSGHPASVGNVVLNSTSNSAAPTVESSAVGTVSLAVTTSIASKGTGLPGLISSGLDFAPLAAPAPQSVNLTTINSLVMTGVLSGSAVTVSAPSPSYPLCKSGTSAATCVALVLSSTSPGYTGTVTVDNGVVDVTGNLSSAPVVLGSGGVLTGTGRVGGVTVGPQATLAPGKTVSQASANLTYADAPGILNASALSFTGGTLNVRIDGTSTGNGNTTCSGYDQVNVTPGQTALGAGLATLDVFSDKGSNGLPCLVPSNNQPYTIMSSPLTSGYFMGYQQPGAAPVTDANTPYEYTISYTAPPTSNDVSLTSMVNDTVAVSSSSSGTPPTSTYGQQVTFTATISGTGTPAGTVTFTDENNMTSVPLTCSQSHSATVSVSSGIATCTPANALPGGSNAITATYSGDGSNTSNTGQVTQQVNPQSTTTTIAAAAGNANPSTYGQTVTFNVTVTGTSGPGTQASTASPTGTVSFFTGGSTPLQDCTALPVTASGPTTSTATCNTADLPVGSPDSVTASFTTGDSNYATSAPSTALMQTVSKAQTMTTLTGGSPDPSVFGQTVTFIATVSPGTTGPSAPSGNVTFKVGTTTLPDCSSQPVATSNGTSTATCATVDLPVGTQDQVTATYTGDGNYNGSAPSNTSNQTVNQASTSTTLASSSPSGVAAGQQVTYTATVAAVPPSSGTTAPTGTVTFKDGNNPVACGTGTRSLGTSGGVTSATCSVTYGIAIPAQHSITATYNGDTNYSGSSSSPLIQKVVAAGTTTAIARTTGSPNPSPNPSVYGQAVSFTATISPSSSAPAVPPGGTATFFANGTALADCTNVGVNGSGTTGTAVCNTKDLPVGNPVTVSSTYNGDSNYATSSSSSNINQTVNTAATSTAISVGSPNPSVFGQAVTFTATISSTSVGASSPAGTVMFSDGVIPGCGAVPVSTSNGVTTATCQTSSLPVGPSNVTASYSGDPNYSSSASASVAQTVNKATTAVTVLSDGNPSQVGDVTTYGAFIEVSQPGAGTPTGTVVFFDSGNPIANCGSQQVAVTSGFVVATCGVTYFAPGDHSITAIYSGDNSFVGNNASAFIQRVVNNATPGGYWMVASDGGIFNFGPNANFSGSTGNIHLNAPIVGMAEDPATGGYWLVASDGGVFNFNAPYFGSTGNIHLNAPIVGITAAPDGNGYWLVASDGGIFNFGPSATLFGSTGNRHLNQPIVGMAAAPDGNGYWLVASDGGIFNFGPSATLFGSTGGMTLNKPVVGMAAAPDGNGYWLVASDGGIFNFGPSAQYFGSTGAMTLNKPIVGIAAAPDGNGYWLVASDGGIFNFGPSAGFFGSKGGSHLNQPIVGMAAAG